MGVPFGRDEVVEPFGAGWLIRDVRGFRPCPWAFDLADLVPLSPGDRVVDLGCGNGVIGCALFQAQPDLRLVLGVDLDRRALGQLRRNARLVDGGLALHGVAGDVRAGPLAPRAFDLVVANPPFYPDGWGRRSTDPRQAARTHALHGDVADFAACAAAVLAPHGRCGMVFDAGHLPALLLALESAGLRTRSLTFLDDDRGRPSRVVAVAGRGTGGLQTARRPFRG
jgi:tRNA1(Val) A37 N6-methylase TrmN6